MVTVNDDDDDGDDDDDDVVPYKCHWPGTIPIYMFKMKS